MNTTIRASISLVLLTALGCSQQSRSESQAIKEVERFLVAGMSVDQAKMEVSRRKFRDVRVNDDQGVWIRSQNEVIGERSIQFTYDDYWEGFLRRANITVSVAFDEEGRLLMVSARKTVDAP
ncbi:hypothetical protein [Marilutibacter spongiae]|uniref:Uncharacterized protein n=1 Tax=Marilutibacter spongiae TaxID=2025720 RepID=A0A7W3TJM0_9GAMM|nr:hypothetical protein [Lysobacter spongiae]MBB1059568.1 hypothetical protein [Lysobacter spongiae]